MPILIPEKPSFKNNKSEEKLWKQLKKTLPDDVYLFHSVRVTDTNEDKESDFVIIWPRKGLIFIEVKGGYIKAKSDGTFEQGSGKNKRSIDPVGQIHGTMYAVMDWIHSFTSMKSALPQTFLVAFPEGLLPQNYQNSKIRRNQFIDKDELGISADIVQRAIEEKTGYAISPSHEDCERIADTLRATIVDETNVESLATIIDKRSELVEQYVQDNERLLDFVCDVNRFHVKGSAGTGKTALALAQASRLKKQGKRVAFLCYSRILAASIRHRMESLPKSERIDVVSTFHHMGDVWGVSITEPESDEFWAETFGQEFLRLAATASPDEKFDAIVIDEAQDFAASWWDVLGSLLRSQEDGGIYAFGDDAQEIFGKSNGAPRNLVPLNLHVNLRNADPIASLAGAASNQDANSLGIIGPNVYYVELRENSTEYETITSGDDVVEHLREYYQPRHIALLTTKSRHPVHKSQAELDPDGYARRLWDESEIFYGTVSGFKGLERNCIVLVINGVHENQNFKELIYTGVTRARDLLVIVSERSYLEKVFGNPTIESLERITL